MDYPHIFTREKLDTLFPLERTDAFFEALFGGAEEGAYDISVEFVEGSGTTLSFAFLLRQRPGKCLACNLTYGLPQVFSRHPILNVGGFVREVAVLAGGNPDTTTWRLGATRELSRDVHSIPLSISLK